ncbi:CENPX protein, partial [Orthonyx spaldingii]|nr:CENPX protein [Orthonyx spaldingii]
SSVPLSAQDTVDRLLRLHFRDGRTRVNADAQLLMAELLKIFVRGERAGPRPAPASRRWAPDSSPSTWPTRDSAHPSHCPSLSFTCAAEAAARAARQAEAEDLKKVDTEQLEKVLPQLVCNC